MYREVQSNQATHLAAAVAAGCGGEGKGEAADIDGERKERGRRLSSARMPE